MNHKLTPKKAIFFGVIAAAAYKFTKGEGIFNKPRFYSQHKAVSSYLSTYHENAQAGSIIKNDAGWHCIVKTPQKDFVLNIHKTDGGMYLFSETDL